MTSKLAPAHSITDARIAEAIGAAVVTTVDAIRATTRRVARTARAVFIVSKRHVPAWMGVILTVCLFIPGPLDAPTEAPTRAS